jgi:hypothetical protein
MANKEIEYYDIQKNWNKFANYFKTKKVRQEIVAGLIIDYFWESEREGSSMSTQDFIFPRYRKNENYGKLDFGDMLPKHFNKHHYELWLNYDRGILPKYCDYVKGGWCHNSVNMCMEVLNQHNLRTRDKRDWRIVTSPKHSTIWDGHNTLFDLQYLAFGFPVEQAYEEAFIDEESKILPVGEFLDHGDCLSKVLTQTLFTSEEHRRILLSFFSGARYMRNCAVFVEEDELSWFKEQDFDSLWKLAA